MQTQENLSNLRAEFEANAHAEKTEMLKAQENFKIRIASLEREKSALILSKEEAVRQAVDDCVMRFTAVQRNAEANIRSAIKNELHVSFLKDLKGVENRNSSSMAAAVAEERRSLQNEFENMRAVFLERERETAEDLRRLEELHASRVSKLELQVAAARRAENKAVNALEQTKEEHKLEMERYRHNVEKEYNNVKDHVMRTEHLTEQMGDMQRALQEARSKEASYREQLAEALKENRVLTYDSTELNRKTFNGKLLIIG